MKTKIIEFFKTKLNSPSILTKAIKTAPKEFIDYLNMYLKEHKEWEKISYIISGWCKGFEPKLCKTCKKQMTYSKSKHHDYCSNKCVQLDINIRKKIENTCLKKYGEKCPTLNKDILKKREYHNLEKYGIKHTLQLKDVQLKKIKTNNEKYGGNSPICSDIIKEKIKQTCLQKYGVMYTGQSKIKQLKTQITFNEKYNGHPCKTKEIKEKIHKIKCKKSFYLLKEKLKNYVIPMFSENEYQGGYNVTTFEYKWKCVKCGNIFKQAITLNSHLGKNYVFIPRCLNCYPYLSGYSNLEKELIDFCKEYYPNLIINDRELIKPYELDIVIPELKLAIEFNGIYWHSDKFKCNDYHLNKTIECEKIGYRLIHIFEHEWLNKQEIIKSKLLSIFNKDQESVYARKCIIKEISYKLSADFLNKTHIQGTDKSPIHLGLYYNEELVAVMTFGKARLSKKYEWELIRFSSSKHVIGGAGKLLKYFERIYKPKSIVTYADRRFSQGNLYFMLGFTFSHFSSPNYFYTKNNELLTRYQCQKHKLKNILEKFDEKLSESENMYLNGYNKIYDCRKLCFYKGILILYEV